MPTEDVDQFISIATPGEGIFKDRGSKFYGYAYPLEHIDDVQSHLDSLTVAHPKARHKCYAYFIGKEGHQYRANDDGEPSGSAGLPILNTIKSKNLCDILVVVVRYFGGTKLGIPGLINAYKTAAELSIENTTLLTKFITADLSIAYQLKDLGRLYDILKKRGITNIKNNYGQQPILNIEVPQSKSTLIIKQLYADYHGYLPSDIQDDFESKEIKIQITNP